MQGPVGSAPTLLRRASESSARLPRGPESLLHDECHGRRRRRCGRSQPEQNPGVKYICGGACASSAAWSRSVCVASDIECPSPPPDCGAVNEIKARDPVRCRFCGYRIMYKMRTKRCACARPAYGDSHTHAHARPLSARAPSVSRQLIRRAYAPSRARAVIQFLAR